MSSFNNKQQSKALCKVCQDAGKSEAEYRSHFTRESSDPKSKVVCPTLLAQECRYCFKKGHTVKYCQILKTKDQQVNVSKTTRNTVLEKKQVVPSKKGKNMNVFECLESDDEDQEEEEEQKQHMTITQSNKVNSISNEEFPALSSFKSRHHQSVPVQSGNYLAAISTVSKPVPTVEQAEQEIFEEIANKFGGKLIITKTNKYEPSPKQQTLKASEMDWAALESDSDDEEESEDEDW
jgi:hypothetical protein